MYRYIDNLPRDDILLYDNFSADIIVIKISFDICAFQFLKILTEISIF